MFEDHKHFLMVTGSMAGGQTVTLSGAGFTEENTTVSVCGQPAEIISLQPTQIVFITPMISGRPTYNVCCIININLPIVKS